MPSDSQLSVETDSNVTLAAPPKSAVLAFGDYDVVGELGEGGMGRVYKAVDRNLGRCVAVKVLRSTDPAECSRFRGEAGLIATLEHPNIVQIFAVDVTPDGRPYLVLELAEGGSLDRELDGRPLEPRRAAEMMETIARAVQYAHDKGVIHRDLKPANILRSKDRTLKLTDFGLAKDMKVASGMTPSHAVMGTPSYMSPEQAEGKVKAVGPAADVYGLGAILYEMLTGVPPFRGVNVVETLEQVRWAEPVPPTRLALRLPRDLSTICLKCLQKSPARRYLTAGDLADDLRAWMDGRTIAARPAPGWERLLRQVKRRPWEAATVAASALLVVLLVGGLVAWDRREARQEADNQRKRESDEAERRMQAAAEKAAQDLLDAQKKAAAKIRARGGKSLQALEDIRQQLVSGGLKTAPGLEGLHKSLTQYYREFIDEMLADPDAERAKLARLAFEVGELAERSGGIDAAEQLFGLARRLYAELEPGDPPRFRPLRGGAGLRFAAIRYERGDERGAAAVCDELEPLWRGLCDDPRTRAHATRQLAEVEHLRGMIFARLYQLKEADAAYTRSLDHLYRAGDRFAKLSEAELRALEPREERLQAVRYLRGLGRGYGYRGDVHLRAGRVPQADSDYWKSHDARVLAAAVLPDKAATPDEQAESEESRFQLARSWMNLAEFQTRHRAYTTAKQSAATALKLRRALKDGTPNNAVYRLELASNLTTLAELTLLEQQGRPADPKGPLALLDEALEVASGAFLEQQGAVGTTFRAREVRNEARALRAELLADADVPKAKADLDLVDRFLTDALAKSRDPKYRFHRGAMTALRADLDRARPDDPRWAAALADLEVALVKGDFRDKHPSDTRGRRAFRELQKDPRFKKLFHEGAE
jgi:hypothetical protein